MSTLLQQQLGVQCHVEGHLDMQGRRWNQEPSLQRHSCHVNTMEELPPVRVAAQETTCTLTDKKVDISVPSRPPLDRTGSCPPSRHLQQPQEEQQVDCPFKSPP